MAEEITYIPYGLNEISKLDLMTNLANGLPSFMQQYKWLLKPKNQEKFLKAYDDITKNLTGATDSPGRWIINVNNIDTDGMSPKDKEIYEHAAYYIQLQMSLMTPRAKEEEKKKEDLTPFRFTTDFNKYLLRGYGNSGEIFADPELGWDSQDARGSNGLRGTEKRRAAMIKALQEYSDNLEDNKYNFEGTQFTDLADAKAKIQTAINALRDTPNDESDDLPAFSALGLKYRSYFSNGGNEATTHINPATNTPFTYNEWNLYQLQLTEAKAKLEAEKAKAQQANYWKGFKSPDFSKLNGRPLKTEESNIDYLTLLFSKGNWNGDEASQIVTAFKLAEKNGQLVPLSKEELSKLNPNIWGNRSKYLRKINGINSPLYYDTLNKLFKYFYNLTSPQTSFLDILNLNSPEAIAKKKADSDLKLREQYAKRTEMTPQDWEYVASIVPDIASIPDTEPFSAAALAFTGAGMRHHALANRPGGMSTSDKWWLAADYLGAGLAAIPGFGDAYLVGRILNTTRKFATGLFAAAGAYGLGSATVNAFGKWAKGEDMTLQEKMDVVMAIPSLVSAYRLRSREGLNDAAKAANLNNITTNKGKVKVTVTDESGNKSVKEITGLSELKSKELLKQFKNAGNDNSKKTQILKNDSEVQTKASEQGIDLNKVSIETDSRHMASYRKPTEIEFYPETSPSSARVRYDQEIENLKNSGHNWQARRLLIYDKFYKGTGGAKKESDGNWFKKAWHYITDTPNLEFANKIKNGETPKTNSIETKILDSLKPSSEVSQKPQETSKVDPKKVREYKAEIENFKKSYGYTDAPSPITGGYGQSGSTLEAGKFTTTIGGEKITFKLSKSELKDILKDGKINEGKVSEIRGKFARQINELSSKKDVDVKEIAKVLKKLKAKGWLKQGGQINFLDKIIEDFIKNNNI